jgi:hypothetical protein
MVLGGWRASYAATLAALAVGFALSGCASHTYAPAGIGNVNADGRAGSAARSPERVPRTHVLTSDFYNSNDVSVSLNKLSKVLTWAEVPPADQGAVEAAGIKTMLYFDPTFQPQNGPLYSDVESTFEHDCSGNRITQTDFPRLYLMSRNSKEAALAKNYLASVFAVNSYDAAFEDSAGELYTDDLSSQPCDFHEGNYIARDAELESALAQPLIPSALDAFFQQNGNWHNDQKSVQLAFGPDSIGGEGEECYDSDSNPSVFKLSGSLWEAMENTEIKVEAQSKMFFCYARNFTTAGSPEGRKLRMYDIASFLLTYKPELTVLWERFRTPSNVHVFPESQLVALDPLHDPPDDISGLEAGGAFYREYASCFYAGDALGPCAVIVNPSATKTAKNPLYHKYATSLELTGPGLFDGGKAAFTGPTPPDSLPTLSAFIVK